MTITWEAVIALVALIIGLLTGGSLYVRMVVNLAVAQMFEKMDERYAKASDLTALDEYTHRMHHAANNRIQILQLEVTELKARRQP